MCLAELYLFTLNYTQSRNAFKHDASVKLQYRHSLKGWRLIENKKEGQALLMEIKE